jgi:tetratricopeptide (TPR) repeat protein
MARVVDYITDTPDADIARAEGLVARALAVSSRSSIAHYAKGQMLRAQRRFQEAIPEYETAAALNPNWASALFALAQCKLHAGSIEETIPLTEQAIRLSPRDHELGVWCQQIAWVHVLQSRIGEAIVWLERASGHAPAHPAIRALLASAYALNGEVERAAAELAAAQRLCADDRYSSLARLRAVGWGVPIHSLLEATYFAGLRKAGMPEE